MYKQSISLSECMNCLDILEKKQILYFGKKEEFLQRAKKAFCNDIDSSDFLFVQEFMNKFPSIIDEQTESQVIEEAYEVIEEWHHDAINSNSFEEIREYANDMYEIERAFDIEGYSTKLHDLADDKEREEEMEYEDYETDTTWRVKREPSISDRELDDMFKKL